VGFWLHILSFNTMFRSIVSSPNTFWNISHAIYHFGTTYLSSPHGTPLEITRGICAFTVLDSIFGSIPMFPLFRASKVSHLYVPWSLFSSTLRPITVCQCLYDSYLLSPIPRDN
jgi:hypothetical protein